VGDRAAFDQSGYRRSPRPARTSRRIVSRSPFANEIAARAANNNANPPDLSLMTKARHDGPAYIYSLLTGYQAQSAEMLKKFPDVKTPAGLHANPYFATMNIAMPPPLNSEGQVQYLDGTKPTVDQMANRHRTGIAVMIYLLIGTLLAYGAYRNVWRDKKH
jgi:ubiquinol-cytochrome c reductase cytochrome c1 subunit